MGLLTDLWNQIAEFLGIEVAEPIVPESKEPPKPKEPTENVTTLPEKTPAIAPIEEIEPLPSETITEPTPIGEQGRADRIEVLPAKEPVGEPEGAFLEPPSVEDYPSTMRFHVRRAEDGMPIEGAKVTCYGQTATTDSAGICSISGRAKIRKPYPITASKAGYKTVETEVGFAFTPPRGYLGTSDYRIDMERL